ncbi:MAG: M67 family metallopeptidase [Anaerolineae bacterium]|nr:M67 family metallopeptidase [Anaerolineae bacterium]
MTVILSPGLLARLHEHLQGTYPNEGGGFLLGTAAGEVLSIVDTQPIRNSFATEEQFHRYAMTPADWVRLEDEADARGLTLLGYYHSHPDDVAVPSEYDRVHALPNFVYIILSVRQGQPQEARAWRLTDDRTRFDELDMRIPADGA